MSNFMDCTVSSQKLQVEATACSMEIFGDRDFEEVIKFK